MSNADGDGVICITVQRQDCDADKISRHAGVGLLKHWLTSGVAGMAVVHVLGVRSLSQHCAVLAVLASYHGRAVVGADAGGDS